MGKRICFCLLVIACFYTLSLEAYKRPSQVDEGVWELLTPYLMPKNHSVYEKLNKIFKKADYRVTRSQESMEKAGFYSYGENHTSGILVMAHDKLDGWLVKVYCDDHWLAATSWEKYIGRCRGVEAIKKAIDTRGYHKYFATPSKYIYTMPLSSEEAEDSNLNRFLLVVQNMRVLRHSLNKKYWRSSRVKDKFLRAFFEVVQEAGMADCWLIDNAPWGLNDKVNFIDTEHYHMWPINYTKLLRFLDPKLHTFWFNITHGIEK